MPCASSCGEYAEISNATLKKELDTVTRLLCFVCRSIDNNGQPTDTEIKELSDWWQRHKMFDRLNNAENEIKDQQ